MKFRGHGAGTTLDWEKEWPKR